MLARVVSKGHPVLNLDTLSYLLFTCKRIVSEQFGHPSFKVFQQILTPIYQIWAKISVTSSAVPSFSSNGFCLLITRPSAPPGLGTSTMKEAKEYFSDMIRHRIPFKYAGPEDDSAIILVSFAESSFHLQTRDPSIDLIANTRYARCRC